MQILGSPIWSYWPWARTTILSLWFPVVVGWPQVAPEWHLTQQRPPWSPLHNWVPRLPKSPPSPCTTSVPKLSSTLLIFPAGCPTSWSRQSKILLSFSMISFMSRIGSLLWNYKTIKYSKIKLFWWSMISINMYHIRRIFCAINALFVNWIYEIYDSNIFYVWRDSWGWFFLLSPSHCIIHVYPVLQEPGAFSFRSPIFFAVSVMVAMATDPAGLSP